MPKNSDRNNYSRSRNEDRRSSSKSPDKSSLDDFENEIDGQIEPSDEKEE